MEREWAVICARLCSLGWRPWPRGGRGTKRRRWCLRAGSPSPGLGEAPTRFCGLQVQDVGHGSGCVCGSHGAESRNQEASEMLRSHRVRGCCEVWRAEGECERSLGRGRWAKRACGPGPSFSGVSGAWLSVSSGARVLCEGWASRTGPLPRAAPTAGAARPEVQGCSVRSTLRGRVHRDPVATP